MEVAPIGFAAFAMFAHVFPLKLGKLFSTFLSNRQIGTDKLTLRNLRV